MATARQPGRDWMSESKLSDAVCSKLKQREVTMDELLEFHEMELKSFCDDMEFDHVQKARLLRIVKDTRAHQEYKEEEQYNNCSRQTDDEYKTMIVTQQENDGFNQMCARQQKVQRLISVIMVGCNSMDNQCNTLINDIICCFDEFSRQLRSKQQELLKQIDDVYKDKTIAFKQQSTDSHRYFEYITRVWRIYRCL